MYNEEYKKSFLETLNLSDSSLKTYYSIFNKTEPFERKHETDLYDMDNSMLDLLFRQAKRQTKRSAIIFINTIKNYITWAIDNGHSASPTHPIVDVINDEYVSTYVWNAGKNYYNREELLKKIELLDNNRDMAIVLLLFEGIVGSSFSEIRNLRIDDITTKDDKFFLNVLSDEINLTSRQIEITKELHDLLIKTYNTSEIKSPSGKMARLVDGEYIFRKNRLGKDNDVRITPSMISTIIMQRIKDSFSDSNITATTIEISGMMWYANEWMNENGDRIFDLNIVEKLVKKYNLSTISLNNKEYPQLQRIRETMDFDYMQDEFGHFEVKI